MTILPPLRRRILAEVLKIVFLFGTLGFILIISLHLSRNNPQNILKEDQIANTSIMNMFHFWTTLYFNIMQETKAIEKQNVDFDKALKFFEENYRSESEIIVFKQIRALFDKYKDNNKRINNKDYMLMVQYLNKLMTYHQNYITQVNADRASFANRVVFLVCIVFLIGLGMSVYFSEKLSSRIAQPIKKMTEILQNKPSLNQKLKFPEPSSLEVKVLMMELTDLWKELSLLHTSHIKSLQTQRNELESIVAAIDEAVVVLNEDHKIDHYNHKFSILMEAHGKDLIGEVWNDVSLSSVFYIQFRNFVRNRDFEETQFSLITENKLCNYRVRKRFILDDTKAIKGVIYLLRKMSV